jgi:hypothetical protein
MVLPAEHVDTGNGVARNDIPLCHFIKYLASIGSTWARGAEAASLGSAAAAVWPLGAWSSSTEASSADNTEDSVETKLSETGQCTARSSMQR